MLRILVLASLVLAACSSPTQLVQVRDCPGAEEAFKPSTFTVACGDGALVATHIRWTTWDGTVARGTATAAAIDCTPDCAHGHLLHEPMTLELLTPRGGRFTVLRVSSSDPDLLDSYPKDIPLT